MPGCCCCRANKPPGNRTPDNPDTTFLAPLVLQLPENKSGRDFALNVFATLLPDTELNWPENEDFSPLLDEGLQVHISHSTPGLSHTASLFSRICRCCCNCGERSQSQERSMRYKRTMFVHFSLSVTRLLDLGARQEHHMLLNSQLLRNQDLQYNQAVLDHGTPEQRKDFLITENGSERQLVGDELAIQGTGVYDSITVSAKYCLHPVRELFYVYGHTRSYLSSSDALKIAVRAISEGGIDFQYCIQAKDSPLVAFFPEPHEHLQSKLKHGWLRCTAAALPCNPPIDKVRYYFGEQVAIYFAFLGHTAAWLTFPAVLGTLAFFLSRSNVGDEENRRQYIPIFGVILAIWSTLFLEFWKRRQHTLAVAWGMESFESQQAIRPAFFHKARGGRSRITGHVEPWESSRAKLLRLILSYTSITTLVIMVMIAVFSMFVLRVLLKKEEEKGELKEGWGDYTTSIINALQIQIMGQIYKRVAYSLTNYENHQTQTQWDDSLVTKTCLFQFVNSYASLFYIAFLKNKLELFGSKQDCDLNADGEPDCLGELSSQIFIILLVRVILGNIQEVIIPIVKGWLKGAACKNQANALDDDAQPSETEKRARLLPYNTFDDFLELLIMFGYASMFSVAFPLAPLIVLVNAFIETRVDAQKLFTSFQRPIPHGAQDIGSWYTWFTAISYISILTTVGISVFTNTEELFGYSTFEDKLKMFIVLEHLVLAVKFLAEHMIADTPSRVKEHLLRRRFLVKKHIKKRVRQEVHRRDSVYLIDSVAGRGGSRRGVASRSASRLSGVEIEMRTVEEGAGTGAGGYPTPAVDVTNPLHMNRK